MIWLMQSRKSKLEFLLWEYPPRAALFQRNLLIEGFASAMATRFFHLFLLMAGFQLAFSRNLFWFSRIFFRIFASSSCNSSSSSSKSLSKESLFETGASFTWSSAGSIKTGGNMTRFLAEAVATDCGFSTLTGDRFFVSSRLL